MFGDLPRPSQPPFKGAGLTLSPLCCVTFRPQAKSQQDKRMWILHLKRLILENHPAKIPAKVKAAPDSCRLLFIDVINTNWEWDLVEVSLPHITFLSQTSPSFFLCSVLSLIFYWTVTLLTIYLPLAMCK